MLSGPSSDARPVRGAAVGASLSALTRRLVARYALGGSIDRSNLQSLETAIARIEGDIL
jgi:hypothetical protein